MDICSRAMSFWNYQVSVQCVRKSAKAEGYNSFPQLLIQCTEVSVAFLLSHQAHQERAYQEYLASMAMEKAQQQEGYFEQMTAVSQSELACIPHCLPHAVLVVYASYWMGSRPISLAIARVCAVFG